MRNGRCKMHGGKTPTGIGLPQFKHGRFSKALPASLISDYQDLLEDARLIELRDHMALEDTRIKQLLGQLRQSDGEGTWGDLSQEWRRLKVGLAPEVLDQLKGLGEIIESGQSDTELWEQIRRHSDNRRKLSEAERRRLVEMNQVITTERMMALLAAITAVIKENVHERTVLAGISKGLGKLLPSAPIHKS